MTNKYQHFDERTVIQCLEKAQQQTPKIQQGVHFKLFQEYLFI